MKQRKLMKTKTRGENEHKKENVKTRQRNVKLMETKKIVIDREKHNETKETRIENTHKQNQMKP